MKTNSLLKVFSKRQIVSMIFPASCIGCDCELETSAFDDTLGDDFDLRGFDLNHPIDSDGCDCREVQRLDSVDICYEFRHWQQAHWCEFCWRGLTTKSTAHCQRCGAALLHPNPLAPRCAHCHGHDLRFDRAFAVGNYQGLLQQMVIRMKNQHDEPLAIQLGRLLGYELFLHDWTEFDQVIPVPSHWFRKFKRGFQAADILADAVSQLIGVAKHGKTVRTVRPTLKQGTLSTTGRQANVRNAFELYPKIDVRGKKLLLIDDVMTSGSTTSEIARVLKRGGAKEVCVSVVARGAGVS